MNDSCKYTLPWVELCLLERCGEVASPSTCDCDLIWKNVFEEVITLKYGHISTGPVLIYP